MYRDGLRLTPAEVRLSQLDVVVDFFRLKKHCFSLYVKSKNTPVCVAQKNVIQKSGSTCAHAGCRIGRSTAHGAVKSKIKQKLVSCKSKVLEKELRKMKKII